MRAERRKHQRAQLPGMRVVYEDAAGHHAEGDALDVGAGGVFVRCDQPAPAGKGLSLELVLKDESARLSALGRVVWVRSEPAAEGPAGMGIRFVDAEPAVLSRIEQLVASRERTEPGTGGTKTPAREPTVMGVGSAQTPPAPAAPIIAVAPTRERTVLGVGGPDPAPQRTTRAAQPSFPEPPPEDGWEPAKEEQGAAKQERAAMPERSLPIELVTTKAKVEPAPPSEASLAAAGVPGRRSRALQAILVVLLAAGCAIYFFRRRIPWVSSMIERGSGLIAPSQPMVAPPLQPRVQPPASTPAPTEAPAAPPSVSAAPVASASSSTTAAARSAPATSATHAPAASAKPPRRPPPRAPWSQSPANRGGDNPY